MTRFGQSIEPITFPCQADALSVMPRTWVILVHSYSNYKFDKNVKVRGISERCGLIDQILFLCYAKNLDSNEVYFLWKIYITRDMVLGHFTKTQSS